MIKRKSDSPVKVSEQTKERLRIAAAVSGTSQGDILDAAVDEYISRHAQEFATGFKRAGAALFEGEEAHVAYLMSMGPH
jgi:hypothetical protein